MARADEIGRARCWNPDCPAPLKARVSLSRSGLAVMTCNGCQSQVFTRSEISDEGMRKLIHTAAVKAGEPAEVPQAPMVKTEIAQAVETQAKTFRLGASWRG